MVPEHGKELKTILLIDDEPDLLESCVRILNDEKFFCVTTESPDEAIKLARKHNPHVVVTDYLMPGKNGVDVLKEIKEEFPDIPVIMMSAYATIDGVVEAVKTGAFDYITKPFTSDQLIITIRRAIEQSLLQRENLALRQKLKDDFFNHYFVGKHPKFIQVIELIQKIAVTESNVLIRGETGTGKGLAARAIHMLSRRADGPFLAVDCATLTKEMIEAAAPPKESDKNEPPQKSIFEAANGGTLFFEQVEELDPSMQVRLLRILQDRKVPVMDKWEQRPVDVRVVASTTVDLYSAVAQKKFRENLYYCLNVFNIEIPPLRERKEDVGILCDHFFRQTAGRRNSTALRLHPETLARLMEYDWPGNVRELLNIIERVGSLAKNNALMIKDLPHEIRRYNRLQGLTYKEARNRWMEQFEKYYLENLLFSNKGNITRASEKAGIARMSLYRMLNRTGLRQMTKSERGVLKKHEILKDA